MESSKSSIYCIVAKPNRRRVAKRQSGSQAPNQSRLGSFLTCGGFGGDKPHERGLAQEFPHVFAIGRVSHGSALGSGLLADP